MFCIGIFLETKNCKVGSSYIQVNTAQYNLINLKCLALKYRTSNYVTSNYPVLSVNIYKLHGWLRA